MDIINNRKFLPVMLIIQILLVVLCIITGLHELVCVNIPYKNLIGTTIPDERDGWYIDDTFPCSEDGLFDYSEEFPLNKGTYNITVRYETDTETNYSTVTAGTVSPYGLYADKTPLVSRKNEVTYTVYLLEDVTDFKVRNYYQEGYLIIKDISINETRAYLRMKVFSLLVLFILIDGLWLAYKKNCFSRISQKQYAVVFLVTALAVFTSMQIWDGYLTDTQDLAFHLLRIEGLKDGLRSGQFPVKMQPNWLDGYGYPVSVYYGDLFLYIPAVLRLVGFPVQFAYSVFIFLMNLATAGIAYWCCVNITQDRLASLVSTALYILVPYRLTDLYERNAFGETLALTFLPLIVYGMYQIFTQDCHAQHFQKRWIPLVIGFTGIIESHVLTCIMCAFFIIIDCIIHWKKVFERERFIVLAKTVIYTSLLNAGFIFPCITSMEGIDITNPYRADIRIQDRGALLTDMFSAYNPGNTMILSVGAAVGFSLLLYLTIYIAYRTDSKVKLFLKEGLHIFVFAILALYMSTAYFPWNRISELLGRNSMIVSNIQFQWRFLGLASVFTMVVCCFALTAMRNVQNGQYYQLALLSVSIIVFITGSYVINTRISNYPHFTVYDIDKYGRTDHNVGEYLLDGTDFRALEPDKVSVGEGVQIGEYNKKYTDITLTCSNQSDSESYVEVPLLYYKQYRAKDGNGNRVDLVCGDNNVLRVVIPQGFQGSISIHYTQPVFWRICEVISLLMLLAMIASQIRGKYAGFARDK